MYKKSELPENGTISTSIFFLSKCLCNATTFFHYTCIIPANMHQFILLMSVRGGLAVMEGGRGGVCCVCTLRSSYQSGEFMYHGLCPGLHTGNNNSYGCSRHPHHHHLPPPSSPPPPPPIRQVHLKPTSVNHTIHVPQPFLSPPRPPPRHAHGSDSPPHPGFNIITMQTVQMTMHNTIMVEVVRGGSTAQ